jgi:hypothetical protein
MFGNLKLGPLAAHWSSDLHTSVVGPFLFLLKKVCIKFLLVLLYISSKSSNMASDTDRNFRRLMKKYRVVFKSPSASDQWPFEHFNRFDSIRKIRFQRLETFCPPIDILSEEKPWKEKTRIQARWLAKRASHLFNQQRNEAGWRLGLENDVLRRLTVEVAW